MAGNRVPNEPRRESRNRKFDGYLLCSDFDGTLTVTLENLAALRYFTENGGLFTMATGRNPNYFLESVKGLPINAPVVACNGNAVYDLAEDKLLWSNPMPDETVRRLIRFSIDECPECRMLSLNGLNDNLRLELGARLNADACFDGYLGSAVYPAMELIIIQTPSITAGLREKLAKAFPELSFAQSSPEGLEINTHSGGKGNAVRILRGLLGGEQVIHTIVCAGNYENDLSMLEYADIGYAVGNAAEQVKAVADRVTVPASENAIARIIGELGEN